MRRYFIFGISALCLLWERLWNRFWDGFSFLLLFMALALLNIPQFFNAIVLLGIVSVLLALIVLRRKKPFVFPARKEVERRMEASGALMHRPLEALRDTPVEGLSQDSLSLWRKHLQESARSIPHLGFYAPQPDVVRQDRFALRHAAVILLVVGLVVAQGNAASRLRQAFTPDIGALLPAKTVAFDLWITPPAYTQKAAIFLARSAHDVQVPAGSILKLHATGYRHAPKLRYAGQSYPLTETGPGNFALELPLQQSGDLSLISWFSTLGEWSLTVTPDMPPKVHIMSIAPTPRAATRIIYEAQDDHGIAKLSGIIVGPEGANYIFDIPGQSSHVEDLTPHLWAGMPVALSLEAEDTSGRKTLSAPYEFILPARSFTNPVAKRLIEERKALSHAKNILARRAIAGHLIEIANDPALDSKGDVALFLALTVAPRRLMYDGSDDAVAGVQGLLWDIALKLEDGGLSLAQRELRDALQKMSAALNDKNISKQRLQEILEDVHKKMQQYVQSLATEMQQRLQHGKNVPVLSPEIAQKFMQNIDLGKMLQQMEQMLQANSREDLQKMADSLKNTIDNLDIKKFDEMQEKQMQAMKSLQDLDDIVRRQQKLFDETNKSSDPTDAAEQKREQSGLRQKLGESLRALGEFTSDIPENFPKADQGMKQAEDALGTSTPRASLPHQKTALDELQKGLDDAIKKMAMSMQQSIMSFGGMPGGGNFGKGFDPLGRGLGDDGETKIPDQKDRRRVQEIIEELRNRSNEPNRTKVERDYIDRLLDRF